MEGKLLLVFAVLFVVLMVSGCIGEEALPDDGQSSGGQCNPPKKMIGQICCYDENSNGICDIEDMGCPDSCDDGNICTNDTCSASTDFECVHEANSPCCGNGVCEPNEDVSNTCPDDCTIIKMSQFKYSDIADYMDGDTFVFIHTGSAETEQKMFYLNITAGPGGMENIKYTYTCNSTQYDDIDSINSEAENVTEDVDMKINKYEDKNYVIYTNFFIPSTSTYSRDIKTLEGDQKASFHFSVKKKVPQERDDLKCLVKFYFVEPRKIVYEWLSISYI